MGKPGFRKEDVARTLRFCIFNKITLENVNRFICLPVIMLRNNGAWFQLAQHDGRFRFRTPVQNLQVNAG